MNIVLRAYIFCFFKKPDAAANLRQGIFVFLSRKCSVTPDSRQDLNNSGQRMLPSPKMRLA